MKDLPDDELMLMYRSGHEAAFHELFERYHALVFNFARMMLRDTDHAEEVLQEAFLSVARSAGHYEAQGSFRTWLMRIVRNRCLNVLVSRNSRSRSQIEIWEREGSRAQWPSPAEQAESAERLGLVQKALTDLPEGQREAILLYAFDSMSYQEIAAILHIPINTVKTLIHRGRAALARALEAGEYT